MVVLSFDSLQFGLCSVPHIIVHNCVRIPANTKDFSISLFDFGKLNLRLKVVLEVLWIHIFLDVIEF